MLSADCEMKPRPRHSKYGRNSKTSAIARSAGAVAFPRHDPLVLILDRRFAGVQLAHDHEDRFQDVERFETGDDDGLAVVARDELVRAAARDRRDVTRSDESVDAHVRRVEDRAHRGNDRHVVAEDREVRDAESLQRAGSSARSMGRSSRSRSQRSRRVCPGSVRRCAVRRAASRPCECPRPAL